MRTLKSLLPAFALLFASAGFVACGPDDEKPPLVDAGEKPDEETPDEENPDEECVNTKTTCDECTTPTSNPYDACSDLVGGCVAFGNALRVPGYPNNVPKVP